MSEFIDGTAKFKVTKSCGVLPGTVTAFSGTFNDGYPVDKNTGLVNREWHLCDGTNDTPDLRSRFIYGRQTWPSAQPVTANDLRGVIAAAAVTSNRSRNVSMVSATDV